jgi:hypothetical protein
MAQNFVGSNNINLLVPQGPAPPLSGRRALQRGIVDAQVRQKAADSSQGLSALLRLYLFEHACLVRLATQYATHWQPTYA